MSLETVEHLSRTARVAYSRHPVARLYRTWHRWTAANAGNEIGAADILLLPLAGLALSLLILSAVPDAGAAIADACATACMP